MRERVNLEESGALSAAPAAGLSRTCHAAFFFWNVIFGDLDRALSTFEQEKSGAEASLFFSTHTSPLPSSPPKALQR